MSDTPVSVQINENLFRMATSSFIRRFRHELAHTVYVRDILEHLLAERISLAKAIESIEVRIAGNEPALPYVTEQE